MPNYTLSMTLMVFLMTACSSDILEKFVSKKEGGKDNTEDNSANGVFDFQKTCGLSEAQQADPSAVVFQQNLQSLPIVVIGSDFLAGNFRVITRATANVTAKSNGQSTQVLNVALLDSATVGGLPIINIFAPGIVKSKAEEAAKSASGTTTREALTTGQLLNLVTSNQEFDGVLCGISLTKKQMKADGDGTTATEFEPALPVSINPLAPRETVDKEVGRGRVFRITAKVTQSKAKDNEDNSSNKGMAPVGSYPGTITVRPVNPTFQAPDGNVISGERAYEVISEFPTAKNGAYGLGLPKSSIYFLQQKSFSAIVIDTGAPDVNGAKVPLTIMIKN